MSQPDRRRGETRLLVVTGVLLAAAGLLIGALIFVVSRQGGSPHTYRPFNAGVAVDLARTVREDGPILFPDPFGGDKSTYLALEHGHLVALEITVPGTRDCGVKWRDPAHRFVDCHGDNLTSEDLARYETTVSTAKSTKGALLIDLRRLLPPPAPAGTPAPTPAP